MNCYLQESSTMKTNLCYLQYTSISPQNFGFGAYDLEHLLTTLIWADLIVPQEYKSINTKASKLLSMHAMASSSVGTWNSNIIASRARTKTATKGPLISGFVPPWLEPFLPTKMYLSRDQTFCLEHAYSLVSHSKHDCHFHHI